MRRPLWAALLLASAACARALPPSVSGVVDLTPPGSVDTLRMVYLGTGGWLIERGEDLVLTGPLFSNPGLVRTGFLPIRSDTAEVDRHMSRYDVSSASVILVGHAHYDHLMDVPRVATAHAPMARIAGSRTVANTLGTWSGLAGRIDLVGDSAGNRRHPGRWLWYGERVRVMPLESHHAPHFDGHTLYQGTRTRPLAEEPRWASEWVDGATYAFLVDFMGPGESVAYRIYYQDAVAAPPAGSPAPVLIDERPVDVAVLVPATFDQADWYPESLIENLRPRRVLLGHWEDFFKPIEAPTESNFVSDMRHFESRLTRVFEGDWWRPELWTEFLFPPAPSGGSARAYRRPRGRPPSNRNLTRRPASSSATRKWAGAPASSAPVP